MNRYIVTLTSASSSRCITVAADGIIDARIKADQLRSKGESVSYAIPYESRFRITVK